MLIEGNFKIGSRNFSVWFNNFREKYTDIFPHPLEARNFINVIRRVETLTGKPSITVNEFIGHFAIIYNETGGTFKPVTEKGPNWADPDDFRNDAYFFMAIPGKKRSYNQGPQNMPAGDLLRDWGVISRDEDVEAWNSTTEYPINQPEDVRRRARDCDFYKFRGRGLNQITWRTGYTHFVDPVVAPLTTGQMTNAQLDAAFTDPAVYCGVFRNYISDPFWAGKAIGPLIAGDFTQYPLYVAGKTATEYQKRFVKRCQTLKLALKGGGVE